MRHHQGVELGALAIATSTVEMTQSDVEAILAKVRCPTKPNPLFLSLYFAYLDSHFTLLAICPAARTHVSRLREGLTASMRVIASLSWALEQQELLQPRQEGTSLRCAEITMQ